MKKLYGLLLALSICLAACAGGVPAEMTDAERNEIQAAVESQMQLIADAHRQLDPNVVKPVWTTDVEIAGSLGLRSGVQEAFDRAVESIGNYQSVDFAWEQIRVEALCPEWALAKARATVKRQHNDGRIQETNPYLFYTGIFHAIDGEWKLARGHWSGSWRTHEDSPQ